MGDRLIVTLSQAAEDTSALRLVELMIIVIILIAVISAVAMKIQRRRETARPRRLQDRA